MKRLTHPIAICLVAAVTASIAYADSGDEREDLRHVRFEPFKRNGMPRWLPEDDSKQVERIIEEFTRGDFRRAEGRWASLVRKEPYASKPRDARRLADYIYLSIGDGSHDKLIQLEDKVRFHAERRAAADAQLRSLRRALPEARECGHADVVAYSLNRHWTLGAPAVRERRVQRMTYGGIRSSISWWQREAERIESDWLRAARDLRAYQRRHDDWRAQNEDDCRRILFAHVAEK